MGLILESHNENSDDDEDAGKLKGGITASICIHL